MTDSRLDVRSRSVHIYHEFMCITQTSLLYGIIVKTWSLFIAARAHPRIVPVVLALDMIIRRVENNTLVRSDDVKALPIEIWEMIKKEVYEIAIYDAEVRELAFFNTDARSSPCQCGDESCSAMDMLPRSAESSDASTIYDSDAIILLVASGDERYFNVFHCLQQGEPTVSHSHTSRRAWS